MKALWPLILLACGAEVAFAYLPRQRALQFAMGPLMLGALIELTSRG